MTPGNKLLDRWADGQGLAQPPSWGITKHPASLHVRASDMAARDLAEAIEKTGRRVQRESGAGIIASTELAPI